MAQGFLDEVPWKKKEVVFVLVRMHLSLPTGTPLEVEGTQTYLPISRVDGDSGRDFFTHPRVYLAGMVFLHFGCSFPLTVCALGSTIVSFR